MSQGLSGSSRCVLRAALAVLLLKVSVPFASAQDSVENYIAEYPNQEQVAMMQRELAAGAIPGEFRFSGLVSPADDFVVTPQATVDYGRAWFSLSEGPAIVRGPSYALFFSISVFDMRHNVPLVIANPEKPLLLYRPGQTLPEGDFHRVMLETDQGLVLTRMVVNDNLEEVRRLSEEIRMEGGRGDMLRDVQRFSAPIAQAGDAVIGTMISHLSVAGNIFPRRSGEVGALTLAAGVKFGQLGTPSDTVRYAAALTDNDGQPLNGVDSYVVTVPAGIVAEGGYYSVTAYGTDNQLLIENPLNRYDRTTYSSEVNEDGTYTVTLSPDGEGKNGIPTGEPFYLVLRAYVPAPGADVSLSVERRSP